MGDIFTRLVPLPFSVRGVTMPDENGDYNIYINALLGEPAQKRAYEHELQHIRLGHFDSDTERAQAETAVGGGI